MNKTGFCTSIISASAMMLSINAFAADLRNDCTLGKITACVEYIQHLEAMITELDPRALEASRKAPNAVGRFMQPGRLPGSAPLASKCEQVADIAIQCFPGAREQGKSEIAAQCEQSLTNNKYWAMQSVACLDKFTGGCDAYTLCLDPLQPAPASVAEPAAGAADEDVAPDIEALDAEVNKILKEMGYVE